MLVTSQWDIGVPSQKGDVVVEGVGVIVGVHAQVGGSDLHGGG